MIRWEDIPITSNSNNYFPLYNFYLYYQLSFCLCQPSFRKFTYPSWNKNCTVLTFSKSLPISRPLWLLLPPPPTPSQQSFLQLMDGSLILSHHPVLQRLHSVMILMLCLNFPKLRTSLYSVIYFQANNKYFYMAILRQLKIFTVSIILLLPGKILTLNVRG